MILIRIYVPVALALAAVVPAAGAQEHAPAVRRIAATALLAAQEYRLGFENGRVVSTAEIDEARLFLSEALRVLGGLPGPVAEQARQDLARALAGVDASVPPDSIASVVQGIVSDLALGFGVVIDEVPAETPSLARGASVYQANCASCHGAVGAADGPAAVGLDPAPTDLTDSEGLRDASPLDFYRRVTLGIAGTAMPAFEHSLTAEDRWAVAAYGSTLRLPAPVGRVPAPLRAFATTARMGDAELLQALGPTSTLAEVAAVRVAVGARAADQATRVGAVFTAVRARVDSAVAFAASGDAGEARRTAFDAYFAFEAVEREVRVKNAALATELETDFALLRERAASGASGDVLADTRRAVLAGLERAERVVADRQGPLSLFTQSLVLLVREGLEAILVIGALLAFLSKTGAASRRRDIHIGVAAALGASVLTAIALETVFHLSPARQEVLEGITMIAAAAMLFYVSYWLLSKIEVARWNRFMKGKVAGALSSGSALALASVAFLAVYREGFETVLFYKALLVSAGPAGFPPIGAGFVVAGLLLAAIYVAIDRFGVRLPLKRFFAVTSAFLYYMAFVFAGKAVAEFQEGGLVGTTIVEGAPRVPMMGIYPTVESMAAQAILVLLALGALAWIFLVLPVRRRRAEGMVQASLRAAGSRIEKDVLRSLDRIEADVAEIHAEVDRMRDMVTGRAQAGEPEQTPLG